MMQSRIEQLEAENKALKKQLALFENASGIGDGKLMDILRENERQLTENNALLEGIMSTIPAPLYVKDRKGRYIKCNKAFLEMFGFTMEQVIGNTPDRLFPEYAKETVTAEYILKSDVDKFHNEAVVRTVNGLRTFFIFRGAIQDKTGIVGIMLDISELKEAQNKLFTEKERLQALGDNIPDGCLYRFILDTTNGSMRLEYLGASWEKLIGIPAADAMADMSAVFAVIYPDDLALFTQSVAECTTTMSDFNLEIRKIGEPVQWMQMVSHPHFEGTDVIWDGMITDVTARKNIELELSNYRLKLERLVQERTEELEASNEEQYATNEELYATNEELSATNEEFAVTNEELNQKNEQLRQEFLARTQIMNQLANSESMMRNFIGQSFEGIVFIDHEGKVIEWNKSQETITGIAREEAIGQYDWDLLFRLRPENDRTDAEYNRIRQQTIDYIDGSRGDSPVVEEDKICTPLGEEHYVQLSMFTIKLSDGLMFGRICHDNTEKQLADDELEQYRTLLEEMVEFKTQELVSTQERLISLSDNLPGGVIFQTLNRRFSYISANFTEMFRLDIDAVQKNNELFYDLFFKEDREKLDILYSADDVQATVCDAECRVGGENVKWVQVRAGKRVLGNGDCVWDGFMIDVTNRKMAEQELEKIRKKQSILIKVLQIVQSSENAAQAIGVSLSEIGKYADVSRTYIFEKTGDNLISNTHEWCNQGVQPEIDNLQNIPMTDVMSWFDAFNNGAYICTSDITTLAPEVHEILAVQGIKSILALPLVINGQVYGFVGFDDCVEHREWIKSEIELLISLSQIISNTTRRIKAENSILLSQQTMRTVLDNINANIYVADFDSSEILFANKKTKEEFQTEVEGKICWEVLQHKNAPCEFCPNVHLLDAKKQPTGSYQWEHLNKNSQRWYECTDSAIEWVNGKVVHMEYATDITDRKRAEESLQKSEELYRQLTVASPDAIVVCMPKGQVVYLSPKAREMFLIDEGKAVEDLRMYRYVHSHDRWKATESFKRFISDNLSYIPQLLLKRSDDTEFFGEVTAASVKGTDGSTSSIIMVIRDITERKRSEMELINAKEKAEESDKLKSAFLANMSHEIRTPINGIIGFLSFLNDENLPSKRRREYTTIVNNSSTQLVKLIDDIIDIAKIEAKQMSIRPMALHVNEFMNELRLFFEAYLQSNNKSRVALILDDSRFIDSCVTYVDPTRLRQVISNLISNASKFTEKGFIRLGYRQLSPTMLEFVVEDSGIGLAADQLEVIFERFRQAELSSARKYGGTGLGLTISRNLVQLMGGDIRVESVEGEGATFYFTISYLPVSPKDEPLFDERSRKETHHKAKPFRNMSILVVDQGVMEQNYYEKLLSETGAKVIFAKTIPQWWDAITQQKHIDVVLVNADMLKDAGDDDEIFRKLKSTRTGLPLVLAVPERNEYYQHCIRETKCSKVLDLPTDAETLFHTLNRYKL